MLMKLSLQHGIPHNGWDQCLAGSVEQVVLCGSGRVVPLKVSPQEEESVSTVGRI